MKKIFVIILLLLGSIGCIEEKKDGVNITEDMLNETVNVTDTEKPKEISDVSDKEPNISDTELNETSIPGGESKEEPIAGSNETFISGGGSKEEPGEINISGESGGSIEFQIAKKGDRSSYTKNTPDIVIIVNKQEWNNANLEPSFNIEEINFQNDILIVVLSGQKPSSGYILDINEIRKSESALEIFADVNEPEGGIDVITSPYIIAKVKKDDVRNMRKFVLFINGENVIERNKEIE